MFETADLVKLTKRIPSMPASERTSYRELVDHPLTRMAENGKKIAEHCIETGGKFSVRS